MSFATGYLGNNRRPSAGGSGLSGGDPGANLGTTQRRDRLRRLTAVGQLVEQPSGRRCDLGDRRLEGGRRRPRRVAKTRDLANVLPGSSSDLVVGGCGLQPAQFGNVAAHAFHRTSARASTHSSCWQQPLSPAPACPAEPRSCRGNGRRTRAGPTDSRDRPVTEPRRRHRRSPLDGSGAWFPG